MSPLSLPVLPHLLSSNTWTSIALWSLGVLSTILAVGYIYLEFYQDFQISYKNVPGPPRDSFFWGNFKTILDAPPSVPEKEWVEQYGHTIRFKFMLNSSRLFTTDTTALSYILNHSDVFQKPTSLRRALVELLGNGLLVSEGHEHKRQRKILQSAFNPANIRGMIPIFYDKAYELKDKMVALIEDSEAQCSPTPIRVGDEVKGGKQMDVMKYLGQATLDVIGLAGFDYDFKALSEPRNELAEAYRDMFAVGQTITPMSIFQEVVPGASYLPTKRTRVLNSSRKIAQKVGLELLAKKKRAVLAAHSNNLKKGTDIGKDLLSIVVKANMAIDLRDDQRLPDDEVLAQITTFMLAGNETSSTALTWILHLLALHPGIQGRLREEVTAVSDDRPEMDVLNTLPLLDNVIRESLRLLGPVPLTVREAQKDTVIPLGKPLRGRDGTMLESVTIPKGTNIVIPLMSVNTSTEIWGPDAREFNPDRYDSVDSEKLKHVPGIWGNLLSFLGGTRNCIGYRFALAEIKVILFILIRNLEFQRLKSQPEIEQKASIVMRPRVKGEEAAGLQMPLMVIPLSAYLSS